MTESESVALPLGDTPMYVAAIDSALLLYHHGEKKSSVLKIFFYFNYIGAIAK